MNIEMEETRVCRVGGGEKSWGNNVRGGVEGSSVRAKEP